jgi:hypothetical protein
VPREVGARFFFDENLLPVGRALAAVRGDVVFPGHPGAPEFPPGVQDVEWVAIAGRQGLIAITRDRKIRTRPVERQVVLDSGARLVCITGKQNLNMWQRLDAVVRAWPAIEDVTGQPGPWVKGLAAGSLRDLKL